MFTYDNNNTSPSSDNTSIPPNILSNLKIEENYDDAIAQLTKQYATTNNSNPNSPNSSNKNSPNKPKKISDKF